jgi:segregation and condensation protein B
MIMKAEATPMDNAADLGSVHPDIVRAIEAIIMVASEPIEPAMLGELLDVAPAQIDVLCRRLAEAYADAGHGFELVKVAGGWRYQSHGDMAPYVEKFVLEGQTAKLSGAALETLAIVAYKQPISRAQVASIRGVDPDGVLRTLQARGYVDHYGRDPGPGQALLWGTTPSFLEKLGLSSIDQLPPLAEYVPGADVVEALEQGLRGTPTGQVESGHGSTTGLASSEAEADDLDHTEDMEVDSVSADQIETADIETADIETADIETADIETADIETADIETADIETADIEAADIEAACADGASAIDQSSGQGS